MKKTVERGKTLLVDGPASVLTVSGKSEVLGFPTKCGGRIVVREGKRLPFFVTETADFDISLGQNAGTEEVDGNTIPHSWIETSELLRSFRKKPVIIMVVGKIDSGKTSLCTYLLNRLTEEKLKIAVLDGDLGQSDVGPPCTVATALVTKPLTDLFNLKVENAFFVGVTSPSEAVGKTIEGVTALKAELLRETLDFVVVNTDGWVEGEEAVKYKSQLVQELKPDVVLCIQQKDELKPLFAALEKFRTMIVDSAVVVKPRSAEKRKSLREMSYAKYLADAKVKTWGLNLLETDDKIFQVRQSEEKGLLVGLYASGKKFLGIGVLCEIDYIKRSLKVFTAVSAKPSCIVPGRVRLDENLKEASPPLS